MDIQEQSNGELKKVAEIVGEVKFAMLTTVDEDGFLRSRPMSTLEMDAEGSLWFFTSKTSPKIDGASENDHVNVCYARTDKQDYLSVSGRASTVRDREKMQALWTPWIKPWFPNGLDDPDLVLLKVTIEEAQYWDAPGSAVKRLYGLAKAMMTGNTDALGDNAIVKPG